MKPWIKGKQSLWKCRKVIVLVLIPDYLILTDRAERSASLKPYRTPKFILPISVMSRLSFELFRFELATLKTKKVRERGGPALGILISKKLLGRPSVYPQRSRRS